MCSWICLLFLQYCVQKSLRLSVGKGLKWYLFHRQQDFMIGSYRIISNVLSITSKEPQPGNWKTYLEIQIGPTHWPSHLKLGMHWWWQDHKLWGLQTTLLVGLALTRFQERVIFFSSVDPLLYHVPLQWQVGWHCSPKVCIGCSVSIRKYVIGQLEVQP